MSLLTLVCTVRAAAAAWRECWDEHGAKFYHSAALGRSSWTHPRRDAFLQRYVTLKCARELDEAAWPQVVDCINRIAAGGAVEAESEQLVAFGALAGQLVSAPDAATEPAAALLRVCQTLLQPLMDDMSHLRPALHRAAAENEDLARRLEARRVQLEVLEQRQRTIKAEIRQRQQAAAAGAPPVRRGPIGRRAWTVDSPAESSSATGPLSSVTVELSLSKPLPLLGPPPSASSSLAEWAQGEHKQTEGAGGDVNGGGVRCSGTWSLQAPGEQAAAAEMRLKWAGLNTWQEQ